MIEAEGKWDTERFLTTLSAARIISYMMENEPCCPTKMARRLDYDPRTVSRAIPILLELKLIHAKKSKNSRISGLYELTDLGRRIAEQLLENRAQITRILKDGK